MPALFFLGLSLVATLEDRLAEELGPARRPSSRPRSVLDLDLDGLI